MYMMMYYGRTHEFMEGLFLIGLAVNRPRGQECLLMWGEHSSGALSTAPAYSNGHVFIDLTSLPPGASAHEHFGVAMLNGRCQHEDLEKGKHAPTQRKAAKRS